MGKVMFVLLCGVTAWAADVAGKWQLVYSTENGLQRKAILELTSEGGKLGGSVTSERGTARIEAGAVTDDAITFSLIRKGNGDEIKVEYKGKIEDGALRLTMQYGKREPVAVIGRRM